MTDSGSDIVDGPIGPKTRAAWDALHGASVDSGSDNIGVNGLDALVESTQTPADSGSDNDPQSVPGILFHEFHCRCDEGILCGSDNLRDELNDNGWGCTFHRHFSSNEIHRDGGAECNQKGSPREVYVFDPDIFREEVERRVAEATEPIEALIEKWTEDRKTYPTTTDKRAEAAEMCLRMAQDELRAALASGEEK